MYVCAGSNNNQPCLRLDMSFLSGFGLDLLSIRHGLTGAEGLRHDTDHAGRAGLCVGWPEGPTFLAAAYGTTLGDGDRPICCRGNEAAFRLPDEERDGVECTTGSVGGGDLTRRGAGAPPSASSHWRRSWLKRQHTVLFSEAAATHNEGLPC